MNELYLPRDAIASRGCFLASSHVRKWRRQYRGLILAFSIHHGVSLMLEFHKIRLSDHCFILVNINNPTENLQSNQTLSADDAPLLTIINDAKIRG